MYFHFLCYDHLQIPLDSPRFAKYLSPQIFRAHIQTYSRKTGLLCCPHHLTPILTFFEGAVPVHFSSPIDKCKKHLSCPSTNGGRLGPIMTPTACLERSSESVQRWIIK